MAKGPMKGLTCIERKGTVYWYARIDGRREYCGRGDDGRKVAEAARKKWEVKQFERRLSGLGIKVKRTNFKTVQD